MGEFDYSRTYQVAEESKRKREEYQRRQKEGGDNKTKYFSLRVDESAYIVMLIRKNQYHNEPLEVMMHSLKFADGKFKQEVCSGRQCVFCRLALENDPKVGPPKSRFIYNIVDTRRYHLLEDPERDGKKKFEWCHKNKGKNNPCIYCESGNETEMRGVRYWNCAPSTSRNLLGSIENETKYCHCGKGSVSIKEYFCPECDKKVMYDPKQSLKITCGHCGKKVIPEADLSCDVCDSPKRTDVANKYIKIVRSDNFTYGAFPERLLNVQEQHMLEPMDLRKIFVPQSLSEQANLMGIPNPFVEVTLDTGDDIPF